MPLPYLFDHELEQRCYLFALRVRQFCRKLKWDVINVEDIKQLVRASGSIGANYIEANEKLGDADLRFRLRISRKEAKESIHWLGLVETFSIVLLEEERNILINEANQLRKILSTIIKNIVIPINPR